MSWLNVFSHWPPTSCQIELTNIDTGKNIAFDGEVLIDVVLGKSQRSRKGKLFFRRPPDRGSFYGVKNLPDLAVRDGNWKLLCDYDGTNTVLYDLKVDAAEKNDRGQEHPALVRQLKTELLAWHKSMPTDNGPTFRPPRRKKPPGGPNMGGAFWYP